MRCELTETDLPPDNRRLDPRCFPPPRKASGDFEWNQRVTLKQVTLFWNDENDCYDEKARGRCAGAGGTRPRCRGAVGSVLRRGALRPPSHGRALLRCVSSTGVGLQGADDS